MYFIGIIIFLVLLLNVLIVTTYKRKDFKRYIFVDKSSYKNFFFSLSRYWHQQQYYLETGTNSSIVSSAVVKVLFWRAWDVVQKQQTNAGGPGFHLAPVGRVRLNDCKSGLSWARK